MINKIWIPAWALWLGALAGSAAALPDDNQQPVNIQANRATQQSGANGETTEYFGDVVMTQGSMLVSAEHVVIHSVNREITQIVASGKPARFQQQSDPDKPPVKASANTIDYLLATETVVLSEDAHIDQPDASFSGNRIQYNIATEEVVAEERVNMVFTPASKSKNAADEAQPNDPSASTPSSTSSPSPSKEPHGEASGE